MNTYSLLDEKRFLVREIDTEVMVFDAVRLMDTYQVGALMVVEHEMLVGLVPSGITPARLC
ncbi:MAG TPA: hypothetical protein DEQ62_08500 [Verrucomicrobiales bacterium]|nr:hypothetical protein [Verrucomicrobiales bacterium]